MTRKRSCPLCQEVRRQWGGLRDDVTVLEDAYPVSEGHVLVVPYGHLRVDQLTGETWREMWDLARAAGIALRSDPHMPDVTGVNYGLNDGVSAGQTVEHAHIHVIPRRDRDVENPRGGVRAVIPGKADYQ